MRGDLIHPSNEKKLISHILFIFLNKLLNNIWLFAKSKTIHYDQNTLKNKSGSYYGNGASKTKWRSKQINMQRKRQTKRKQCTKSNMGNVGLVCVLLSCTLFNQLIYQHFSLFMFNTEKNKTRSRAVGWLEGREFRFYIILCYCQAPCL